MASTIGIRLANVKFSRICAEQGTLVDAKGGMLKVDIQHKVSDGVESNSALGEIKVDVFGLPKSHTSEKEYAFRLSITVSGVYEWDDTTESPNLKDESIVLSLSQSLYAIGVAEIYSLSQKLGYPSIKLPWDLGAFSVVEKKKTKTNQAAQKPKRIKKRAPKSTEHEEQG
ncbi:MAG: hypothetical protein Q8N54_04400 [Sulfurimicrobium sp.]|jgi:hypothetical protein|nr:hypothetical protein [Sulfurimicrobium sp.]MDP2197254.1 hypothetical protein [Sulfurimicrobium sp.]MDP2961976.1 hypothetical protein [Sulfurimicrobium sp.]MDP3686238.1 hypothetical protein [Sulfurimicrobium sp.]MDZ7656043.1 hypothetical protein [Sulfurimicrobium sp.]